MVSVTIRTLTLIINYVFCMQFSTSFSYTMVFPILPFMVEFLLPEIEIVSIGKSRITHNFNNAIIITIYYYHYFLSVLSQGNMLVPSLLHSFLVE